MLIKICFIEIVDRLGAGVLHQYDREGHTPLHWASLGGHSHVVRFFIECRAPIDMPARNELGSQPIHWAASGGHVPVVDLLLEAGASIDATDNKELFMTHRFCILESMTHKPIIRAVHR